MFAVVLAGAADSHAAKRSKLQTPGYRGITTAPRVLPQQPPAPVTIGSGQSPQVVVDEGGTAHIVWNERRGSDSDVLRYCRLKRGARACDVTQALIPPLDTSDPGNSPAANTDFDGPQVFALGDEVALLTQRSFRTVGPDGKSTQSPVFMFLSQDGGTTFNPPALVGTGPLSGQAAVYGAADAPRIGLISDTETGGPFFQEIAPGRFTGMRAALGGGGSDGTSSSIAGAGAVPVAAFQNLAGTTTVRTWTGQGDIHDAATWSRTTIPSTLEPLLASGPAGTFLMTSNATGPRVYSVRRVTPPSGIGPPVRASRSSTASRRNLVQDASGRLHASYLDGDAGVATLVARTSANSGRTWGPPRTLLAARRDSDVWASDLGAAADGGGFAVGQIAPGGAEGPIVVAAFGPRTATGKPGLGSLPGGAGDPSVVERCARVEFAAVDIVAPEGCLLSAAGRKGVKVSEGTILLNGLELVPDPGVKLLIDARNRTLDSTGKVTVQARAPGIDPVVLAKDILHIKLPGEGRTDPSGICKGDSLVGFDAGPATKLKGFPISGSIEIFLEEDSTCIPLSLVLPKVFGGVRGDAVLRASNGRGLHLESLDIKADTIPVGPVLIQDLNIRYARQGERWTGGARLTFPPGWTMGASVTFSEGRFLGASITLGFYPGVPVFSGVFLNRVTAGFEAEPLKLAAAARFGFLPLAPPDTFAIVVNGSLAASFGNPFTLTVRGGVAVFNLQLLQAEATIRSDLYFNVKARLQLDLAVIFVRGDAEIWIDGPREEFGGSVGATVKVFGFSIGTAEAILSSKALGICGPTPIPFVEGGFVLEWGKGAEALWGDCDLDKYKPGGSASRVRAAQAGGFTVPRGADAASVRVTGSGGAPAVVLLSPTGERIVPAAAAAGARGEAIAVRAPAESRTYVALRRPRAGAWRVEAAPGSVPIRAIDAATARPDPRVKAAIGAPRRGSRVRTLRWQFPNAQGRTLQFVEEGKAGERSLGTGRGIGGSIRFAPGDGPAGRRIVHAVVLQDGAPKRKIRIGSYVSPGPQRPGRVRAAAARRVRRGLVVRWTRAAGATGYIVRADVSDGRRISLLARGTSVRIPRIGRPDKVTVRVRARGRNGQLGRAALVRVR